MDPDVLAISKVEIIADNSKKQITSKFNEIKSEAEELIRKGQGNVGLFFVCIGKFFGTHADPPGDAPIYNKDEHMHYNVTPDGELVCFTDII